MQNNGSLRGIKVLDFTHVLSGPYATMLLGDMGADIIKIEKKGSGDPLRSTPPLINEQSAYYFCSNRNKKCLELDIKKVGAKALVYRMVEQCDVFAENFRPGVMDRLGFDYETIKNIKPDIIYASLSAFGDLGPYKNKPGFELIIQSLGGLVSVSSDPEGRPAKVQPQVVDICGGMFMSIAILGALYHRQRTGQGQKVKTSLMEGLFALMTNFIYMHLMGGKVSLGLRTKNPMLFPSQSFKTKDSYISTVVVAPHWERFCRALEKPEWIDHPRYRNVTYRVEHYDAMEAMVEAVTVTKKTAEWLEIFEKHQVAAGPINTVEDMLDDPQIKALDMLRSFNHSKAGRVMVQDVPWQMSETETKVRIPPPALGEHSSEILSEFGFSIEEIETLKTEGIVGGT